MDDLISRQAAISVADDYMTDEAQDIRDRIVLLPSAERHGRWKWNNKDEYFYSCSNCGHEAYGNTAEIASGFYNYCPRCGAKMDEVKDEK